jgi:hypothetical protein
MIASLSVGFFDQEETGGTVLSSRLHEGYGTGGGATIVLCA